MQVNSKFEQMVLQPTTLCNLDCKYCYLPERNKSRRMHQTVAESVCNAIKENDWRLTITWHGGEPLSCGYNHFISLLKPFSELEASGQVVHGIQSNATLIDERWADLFAAHRFQIGISIDGPAYMNFRRVGWHGEDSFDRVLRGVECLRKAGLEFSAIAVVGEQSLSKASEIYDFFCELGCSWLGINFEERVGTNKSGITNDLSVLNFWDDLFNVWRAKPAIRIREFQHVLSWMNAVCTGDIVRTPIVEMVPCVAFNGDVVLLSPEFLGAKSIAHDDFVVGNLLKNTLSEILERGKSAQYVTEYFSGILRCHQTCPYFSACGGLSASNKFYETGSTNATETLFCRSSAQRPVDALLRAV